MDKSCLSRHEFHVLLSYGLLTQPPLGLTWWNGCMTESSESNLFEDYYYWRAFSHIKWRHHLMLFRSKAFCVVVMLVGSFILHVTMSINCAIMWPVFITFHNDITFYQLRYTNPPNAMLWLVYSILKWLAWN